MMDEIMFYFNRLISVLVLSKRFQFGSKSQELEHESRVFNHANFGNLPSLIRACNQCAMIIQNRDGTLDNYLCSSQGSLSQF
jgi:hypothetical protein